MSTKYGMEAHLARIGQWATMIIVALVLFTVNASAKGMPPEDKRQKAAPSQPVNLDDIVSEETQKRAAITWFVSLCGAIAMFTILLNVHLRRRRKKFEAEGIEEFPVVEYDDEGEKEADEEEDLWPNEKK